jgi:hypothetical protein
MKKVLVFLFAAVTGTVFSQLSTINPDTVCYQSATLSTYTVPSVGNGVYTWTIAAPGVITSGQGTNSISVNWSAAAPGLINNGVSVTYQSPAPALCSSPSINLNVFIYQVIPTITAIGPYCAGAPCVPLVGSPLGGTFSGPGVINGQFCPGNANIGINTVTYTVNLNGCTFSTTTGVTVNPIPVLSPIQHN